MAHGGNNPIEIIVAVIVLIVILWVVFGVVLPAICHSIIMAGGTCGI